MRQLIKLPRTRSETISMLLKTLRAMTEEKKARKGKKRS